jgi:NitT/TauT family transport system substrate-binding protein
VNRASFAALAAAALAAPAFPALAQTTATFRMGTAAVESYALCIYAHEAGFFKKQGLEAQMTYFPGGGAVLAALVGGSLDYAAVNWGATSNAHVKGIPVMAIAPGGLYTSESPTTILAVAKNNTTIRTAKDLNGKTIAVSTMKDLQQSAIMRWVDTNGGDASTLKFIELPIPEVPPALNANRVDAGIVLEPVLTSVKGDIRVLSKAYDAIAKKLMICTHLGMKDYLDRNAATTRKVVAALAETAAWANANHDKAGEIISRVSKIPLATVSAMARTEYTDKMDLATIQPVIDASVRYKFLDKGFAAQELFWQAPRA